MYVYFHAQTGPPLTPAPVKVNFFKLQYKNNKNMPQNPPGKLK